MIAKSLLLFSRLLLLPLKLLVHLESNAVIFLLFSYALLLSPFFSYFLECLEFVPTITVDKTDGVKIYLSKECIRPDNPTKIITSKCSEINLYYPDGDEMKEIPLPEQIQTSVVGGKVHNEFVVHA